MRQNAIFPEIQALRAVAVGLVLIFHLWPSVLSGGFVGVDVFFVISGYLITGLLVRAALRDGRISLVDFYSRRARRLLPAATVVLAATFVGTLLFLPATRWEETVVQIAASALYVQNWVLAWLSVDYLGAENAASPVQHYWSLSVEEQFYVIWPLIMISAMYTARRFDFSLRHAFIAALAVVFAGSLVLSVVSTVQEPVRAYFVTYTRMWELALGGLLAMSIQRLRILSERQSAALLVLGLAAIVWPAFAYSSRTAFPGIAALVPTLGAAMVILAGDVRLGRFRGLDMKWLGWIGDRSYSIYLWHWPLIVFYTARRNEIGLIDGGVLIALTLLLSHLSYKFIEQRYRIPKAKAEWRPLAYGLASIASCIVVAGAMRFGILAYIDETHDYLLDPRYPGPAALAASTPASENVKPIPSLVALKQDLPVVYKKKCHQNQKDSEPISCILGDANSSRTMVVVGDSHAAQWVPALEIIARDNGWKLVTFTKSACAFSRVEARVHDRPYLSCSAWRENVIRQIKAIGADVVFTSQSRYDYIDRAEMVRGLRSVWSELKESGIQIVPIRDTPQMSFDPGDCLRESPADGCGTLRNGAEVEDPYAEAIKYFPGIGIADLNDDICGKDICPAVVGNIIVWRDRHHLTATYARKLAPYLLQKVRRANISL